MVWDHHLDSNYEWFVMLQMQICNFKMKCKMLKKKKILKCNSKLKFVHWLRATSPFNANSLLLGFWKKKVRCGSFYHGFAIAVYKICYGANFLTCSELFVIGKLIVSLVLHEFVYVNFVCTLV
jgi:hypothetical protein